MGHALYQACIDACQACADACDHCAAECRKEPNPGRMARCIALDIDCAAFCRLAAEFMMRNSELVDLICEDCAEICHMCAEECQQHEMGHCQQCAEACRACGEKCLSVTA